MRDGPEQRAKSVPPRDVVAVFVFGAVVGAGTVVTVMGRRVVGGDGAVIGGATVGFVGALAGGDVVVGVGPAAVVGVAVGIVAGGADGASVVGETTGPIGRTGAVVPGVEVDTGGPLGVATTRAASISDCESVATSWGATPLATCPTAAKATITAVTAPRTQTPPRIKTRRTGESVTQTGGVWVLGAVTAVIVAFCRSWQVASGCRAPRGGHALAVGDRGRPGRCDPKRTPRIDLDAGHHGAGPADRPGRLTDDGRPVRSARDDPDRDPDDRRGTDADDHVSSRERADEPDGRTADHRAVPADNAPAHHRHDRAGADDCSEDEHGPRRRGAGTLFARCSGPSRIVYVARGPEDRLRPDGRRREAGRDPSDLRATTPQVDDHRRVLARHRARPGPRGIARLTRAPLVRAIRRASRGD